MKSIWKSRLDVQVINQTRRKTIHDALGIVITEVGTDYLEGKMPVDERTHQPAGLLHGGASGVLAESLGSIASLMVVGVQGSQPEKTCVGIELNLSHLKGVREGEVVGRATPLRLGKSLHVWEIKIRETLDPASALVCVGRLTVMVRDPKSS